MAKSEMFLNDNIDQVTQHINGLLFLFTKASDHLLVPLNTWLEIAFALRCALRAGTT